MRPIDARRLTPAQRDAILERDNRICLYCCDDADEVDHVVPWSFRHNDSPENLVAACWMCNQIASNKLFDTFEEKRSHILKKRERIFKRNKFPIWTTGEVGKMGRKMRADILANAFIVDTDEDKTKLAIRLSDLGFNVIT